MNNNDEMNGDVGDQNVEKLLAQAYAPERIDEAFAARVKAQMLVGCDSSHHKATGEEHSTPGSERRATTRILRPWAVAAWGSIAAILLIAFGVWLAGQMGRGETLSSRDGVVDRRRGGIFESRAVDAPAQLTGLTAKARTKAAEAKPLAVGDAIQTKANERRRTVLPDGSVLYIDQNTSVTLDAERRLSLSAGQIYLEVSPRDPMASASKDPTFVVKTPDRTVAAMGTRFEVSAGSNGTSVLVTQGKVKVSGVDLPVAAGQQLAPDKSGKPAIAPAPRASHELEWTRELVAAAESPLVPDSDYQGGALIVVDPFGQEARLSLRKYHIDVHVEDGFARTTIDQTYFNHENRRLEGTFYFPIPTDASISRLAMYVEGKLMEGGMAEREHAREVYETILYTQRDPALLEWVDGSTFKMRVFPLEPRQEKRLLLSYVQKLPESYSKADYRFAGGHTMPVVGHWSFNAFIKNGAAMEWKCDSHAMSTTVKGNDLILAASAERVKPDQDVVIQLTSAAPDASLLDQARFSAADHEGARYLMLRYRPNLPTQPQRERRDWVFIYEASGNRDPLLARAQIDVIRTMLENAEHEDRFAIITAGTRTSAFAAELKACVPANIAAAMEFLEKTHLIGALDMGVAIEAATPFIKSAANPYLVHVGTGIPTLGQRRTDLLVQQLPQQGKFIGVGVGKNWSRQFMKSAASRTGGYFTQINPDEPVAWRAFELMSTLNTPRLLDIKVTDEAGKTEFLPLSDSIVHGEEIIAIARYQGAPLPGQVTIRAKLNGQEIIQQLAVDGVSEKADYLPRMWAKQEIDRLVAENPEAHKQRIIDLSKQMYVMSPFTSLLVLENDAMYEQFKVDRGRKDHWALYPAPAKIDVVHEPDPANPNASRKVEDGQRPPREQVLGTMLVRMSPQLLIWPGQQQYYGQTVTGWQYWEGHVGDVGSDWDDGFGGQTEWFFGERGRGGDWRKGQSKLRMNKWAERNELRDELAGSKSKLQAAKRAGVSGKPMRPMGSISRESFFAMRDISGPMPTSAPMAAGQPMLDSRMRLDLSLKDRFVSGNTASARLPMLKQMAGERVVGLKLNRELDRKSMVAFDSEFAEEVSGRIYRGYSQRNYLYSRPHFNSDWRIFGDLLQHAPGMNTTAADIQAVLEAEAAADPADAPGAIDPAARKLIERARSIGWRKVTLDAPGRNGKFTLTFDGAGRYTYTRMIGEGLRETVVCDGATLWHLYPEIGVGSKRSVSRFHLDELAAMAPMYIASADDLARGNDLSIEGDRTVVITPCGAASAKDEKGNAQPYTVIHLTFDAAGQLAEQRMIEMPAKKVLHTLSISPAGEVKLADGDGKTIQSLSLALAPAETPALAPRTQGLVILPMPIRTRQHIIETRKLANDGQYQWSEEDSLAVAVADLAQNSHELQRMVARRFFARDDRRIGFYTLMLAAQRNWDIKSSQDWGDGVRLTMDPLTDHPGSTLAQHIVDQLKQQQSGYNAEISTGDANADAFLPRLAACRYIFNLYQSGRWHQGTEEDRRQKRQIAIDFVRTCRDPYFGWGVLSLVVNYGGDQGQYAAIAEVAASFADTAGLAYAARYEAGQAMYNAGKYPEAREVMRKLYEETLATGVLPQIDHQFRNVMQWNDTEQWTKLMRETSATLVQKQGPTAGIYHAWQVHQLGDQPLAEELFSAALRTIPDDQRFAVIMAAVDYLWQTGQHARADTMLEPLLAEKHYAEYPELWRLASAIATGRGMLARALAFEERALDLEYGQLSAVVNLQAVRSDYGQVLARYQQLADAITTLQSEAPKQFIAKVVRYADRWRALDPDDTAACQSAARILQRLGEGELAWDYLTTPLAEKSNEAVPWANLAAALRQQGDFTLADRAYATAFEVEPTNAQVLWDRAQLLQQSQKFEEARKLFKQLADGKWEPRFNWIQRQAQGYVQ